MAEEEVNPPNIVFMIADDLGWGDLGCYGHPIALTPNLDALAVAGCRFTQYYCAAPKCSSTRASIITGRFPSEVGAHFVYSKFAERNDDRLHDHFLSPQRPLLTRRLRRSGYRTAFFGKWHLGAVEEAPAPTDYAITIEKTFASSTPSWLQNTPTKDFNTNIDRWITDEALDFLDTTEEPFFCTIAFSTPHAPLNPSEDQMALYSNFQPPRYPNPGATQVYYGAISELDTQVGRILEAVPPNTLVIFTSDNGPARDAVRASHHSVGSAGPFRGLKDSLYEGGIRVPFIAAMPGTIAPGIVNSSVLCSVDLFPTFCEIAGVDYQDLGLLDGENATSALLENAEFRRTKPLFWEFRFEQRVPKFHCSPMLAMRDGDYKLLMNPDESRFELYDMSTTSGMREVDATTVYSVQNRMRRLLLNWQSKLPPGLVEENAGSNEYDFPEYLP